MPPQQDNQNNQYDFIVNSGQSKKPLIPPLGGRSSFTQKIILIVGGALILIIVMWVVGSLLSGGGGNTANATKLVQQEEEIARVATEGAEASRTDIRGAAKNIKLSTMSQQQIWLQFLAEGGTEVGEAQQAALQNPATDQQLTAAKSNNTFDSTFLQVMRTYLNDYANTMKAAFDSSKSDTEQELLQAQYGEVLLLLEQLPQT